MTKLEKSYMESGLIKNAVLKHLEKMNDYAMGIEPVIGIGDHLLIGMKLLKHGRKQAAAGNWDKVKIKPAQEKHKEPTFEGIELSTPALVAAYEMKILNRVNFAEIKNGGMQILEKYSKPNDAVKNIYASIEVHFQPITYNILYKEDNLKEIVAMKKSKFEQEYLEFINANKREQQELTSY